uniref:Uncharacterized hydrolase n=1 Tax=Moumouvirus sp. 'Monve' TaxID=1128131 RepID=H2EDD0_9VIRU|nr:uncharacterized hydrolase [Moumouvirus Monve]
MDENIWMEYITSDIPKKEETREEELLSYYGLNESNDKSLQDAKSIWKLIIQDKYKCVYSEYGITFQMDLEKRYYLVHLPYEYFKSNKKYSVILFLHGLTSWSWDCALRRTNLLKLSSRENIIIILVKAKENYLMNPFEEKMEEYILEIHIGIYIIHILTPIILIK